MKESEITDGLITVADVQQMNTELTEGDFKELVCDMVIHEPDLAGFISDRYDKTLISLQHAGITGHRLAALHKHISRLTWGAVLLVWRSQRRAWDGFLPSDETTQKGGGQ